MKLAVMQPYFFPYLGYYQLLNATDHFVFLDNVNYINKGWINRNNILVNGKPSLFTIPLSNGSQNEMINNVKVANADAWRTKFLKTIEMNYKKAPFYSNTLDIIDSSIDLNDQRISTWAEKSIINVSSYLGFQKQFSRSSSLSNIDVKGEERIISICLHHNAEMYVNLPGGKHLYHADKFQENGIELCFIDMQNSEYSQGKFPFVPYLSMIDVLMWNNVDSIKLMLSKYNLNHG
ncbi:MAG: WbqC family protein [Flavobacteriales bacterium]|nr:WbqC family protein [Flavobacteriales bacterium]